MAKSPDDRAPAPVGQGTPPAETSSRAEIDAFLERVRTIERTAPTGSRGRLIFALDATMSRQPTWDTACKLQSEMFLEAQAIGGLDVQLVYFRGMNECRASRWVSEPAALAALMEQIDCRGGHTQIRKVLVHGRHETEKAKVQALVYVGDAMEEQVDRLCARAGELALLGVPVFLFQQGDNAAAESAFREIARLTKGAHCRFDRGSAKQLRELLTAVAVYAAGGRKALASMSGAGARLLLEQLGPAGL